MKFFNDLPNDMKDMKKVTLFQTPPTPYKIETTIGMNLKDEFLEIKTLFPKSSLYIQVDIDIKFRWGIESLFGFGEPKSKFIWYSIYLDYKILTECINNQTVLLCSSYSKEHLDRADFIKLIFLYKGYYVMFLDTPYYISKFITTENNKLQLRKIMGY